MARHCVFAIALLLFSCTLVLWGSSDAIKHKQQEQFGNVIGRLKKAYETKLQPLEGKVLFEKFNSFMTIDDSYFNSKPKVLLLGQYSTGKTSFIQYLLESDFPGMEIGPDATTDSFMAVMYGEKTQLIPGAMLVQDKTKPFRGLDQFSSKFLQHFQASTLPNPVLENITLVDTPGIYPGNIEWEYNFAKVSSWFAEQADIIILFFDIHKLDISTKFQEVIHLIQKHHKKMIVVLNKADDITTLELIRVSNGLMWKLGRIIVTPEPPRVYIGSFWDKDYRSNENRNLLNEHREQLYTKIHEVARRDAVNKVDKMFQRASQVRTHAHVVCHLRDEMPSWVSSWLHSQESIKEKLIKNLDAEVQKIQAKSEFPLELLVVEKMKNQLHKYDFMGFPTCDQVRDQLNALDSMLSKDLTEIAKVLTKEWDGEGEKNKSGTVNKHHSYHSEL